MKNRELLIFIISSPLMDEEYPRLLPDYEGYEQRFGDKATSTKPESNRK